MLSAACWPFCAALNVLTHSSWGNSINWPSFAPMAVLLNTLRLRQNGRRFADDTFKRIFLNEYVSIEISLKFVPKGPINNISALVQIMAWRRSGDKPLSKPMMIRLPTHICVTRPQWVKNWHSTGLKYIEVEWNGHHFGEGIFKSLTHIKVEMKWLPFCRWHFQMHLFPWDYMVMQNIVILESSNRADSRLWPSQWDMSLQCNAVSHWLGATLESAQSNGVLPNWQ